MDKYNSHAKIYLYKDFRETDSEDNSVSDGVGGGRGGALTSDTGGHCLRQEFHHCLHRGHVRDARDKGGDGLLQHQSGSGSNRREACRGERGGGVDEVSVSGGGKGRGGEGNGPRHSRHLCPGDVLR